MDTKFRWLTDFIDYRKYWLTDSRDNWQADWLTNTGTGLLIKGFK